MLKSDTAHKFALVLHWIFRTIGRLLMLAVFFAVLSYLPLIWQIIIAAVIAEEWIRSRVAKFQGMLEILAAGQGRQTALLESLKGGLERLETELELLETEQHTLRRQQVRDAIVLEGIVANMPASDKVPGDDSEMEVSVEFVDVQRRLDKTEASNREKHDAPVARPDGLF